MAGHLLRALAVLLLIGIVLVAWGWRETRREVVALAQRQPPAWLCTVAIDAASASPDSCARGEVDPLTRARGEYSAGHHALALVTLEDYLAQSPQDREARFYAGVAALAAGSGRRARGHLREVPADDRHGAAARFYTAQALLLAGERKAAHGALSQVAAVPGRYRLAATEQIAKLDASRGGWRSLWRGR